VTAMFSKSFDPRVAAGEAVEATKQALGERLLGAVLYGSAASGDFHPGHSDVNVAFTLTTLGAPELEALRSLHDSWSKRRITRPLLLSKGSLDRSLDVFPLEYLLIRECHETLFGEDPFRGLSIDAGELRDQVERTLRAQEMGLAWTYLALARTPSGASHWAARSGSAIAASASGLLHLAGEPVPRTRGETAEKCASRFGVDAESLRLLVACRPGERERVEAQKLLTSAQSILNRLIEVVEGLDRRSSTVSGG
jgi:predicted nucleotidyltransferase